MNPLQQIDFVFFYLKRKITYGGSYGYHNIWNHITVSPETGILNHTLLEEILSRLKADGFITETSTENSQPVYHITFKGLLFDGYENEKKNLDFARRKMDLREKELASQAQTNLELSLLNSRLQKKMICLTVILAIGTSIAAIYYLMEIVKILGWIPKDYCLPLFSN